MFNFLRREPGFYKRLFKLSLPMILQNLITFSLGLIDTFMVSRLGILQLQTRQQSPKNRNGSSCCRFVCSNFVG